MLSSQYGPKFNFVESMPHRVNAVLKAKGGKTQYKYGFPNNPLGECIYKVCYLM